MAGVLDQLDGQARSKLIQPRLEQRRAEKVLAVSEVAALPKYRWRYSRPRWGLLWPVGLRSSASTSKPISPNAPAPELAGFVALRMPYEGVFAGGGGRAPKHNVADVVSVYSAGGALALFRG